VSGFAHPLPGKAWLCLGLLAALLWLFQKAKGFFWVFSVLVLPGTICHELCHYLSGLVLNGKPVSFTVLPRRSESSVQLGAVVLSNLRWYNAFFIGMAPLALLLGAYALFAWTLGRGLAFGYPLVLLIFLVANLAYGAIPSWQDLRMAARSPVGWLLLAAGLGYGWNRIHPPRPTIHQRTAQVAAPT
jgi:hypothetical protein